MGYFHFSARAAAQNRQEREGVEFCMSCLAYGKEMVENLTGGESN